MDEPWTTRSTETDEALGFRVQERREAIGLSLEELATACGVPIDQMLRYETGADPLTATQLCTLADLLEVPLTYFHLPPPEGGSLSQLLDRLSLDGRQQVLALARRLAADGG